MHGLAVRHGLTGYVRNEGWGVVVEAEGRPEALEAFVAALAGEAPALARVESVRTTPVPARGDAAFAIAASEGEGDAFAALVPADAATCDDCLRELFDPADRRHRHPFITCTQCGPRFTIVRDVPYDRPQTTMAQFTMCAACRAEYEDPADRRFHAEAIACPACGPRLDLELEEAVALLRAGAIVAVKGLGGWHLACDAGSQEAVARLRARKHRDAKPFAVMTARPQALVEGPLELLSAPERPIVLLDRRAGAPVADAVAPDASRLGVMLPYTPLHHLLAADLDRPLVLTSANLSDEPIVTGDHEARERLAGIADAFLGHDRPIHRRCEDSVVAPADEGPRISTPLARAGEGTGGAVTLRRSRGYVPAALALPVAARRTVVAAGAELKATFCVARGDRAFLSPHLGDLVTEPALHAFHADLELYLGMLGAAPEVVAHDLHPGYAATRWALEQDVELVGVQHHHAHAAACLAEHGRVGPALAVVFDGTGYGPDGTLWGGELLRCDLSAYERVAHLEAVPLPGGEAAIRQPWRMAAVHLERAGRPVPYARWPAVRTSLRVNAPPSSGMGRLFDAVAALAGLREEVSYEGQAAIELEELAGDVEAVPYACRVADGVLHGTDLVAAVHDDLAAGRPGAQVAA
ncbi:MAG TPA: carbamoyltransferase HypF, partial [Solirubrobacteraceae bacterium]|nr:carbamoyltransferase HypF [Solirubrobacteraceae bacterium]